MGEIASKLLDALQMFWQALDEHERRTLIYVGAYLACTFALALAKQRRERLIAELREEIVRGGG